MGSKVVVTRSKLDLLADSVSAKSGESLPLTIGEMKVAVDSIVLNSQIIGDGELDVDENDYLYFDDDGGGGITPTGTINITTNGTHDVTNYASANVNVSTSVQTQTKSATPSESQQTITPDSGYYLSSVTVGAIDSSYVGTGVARKSSTDLTASGATVTAPAGYYAEAASKSVASGSATTPATTVTANPSISVNSSTGLITATASATKSVAPTVSAGYVSSGTAGTVTVSGSNTSQLSVQAGTTITPTESEQTAVAAGKYTTGAVKIGAISSTYVGSGITQRDDTDLTASGATVTVPAGYYASQETKSVASGSAGTPTATKGTVSNRQITVTPSVTNTTGYITGGTKTGTAVTVTASELASGNKAISQNGTNIDVVGYSTVSVDVDGGDYLRNEIVPTQTLSCTAQLNSYCYGSLISTYSSTLSANKKYLVTFDGTEYVCECYQGDAQGIYVGDYRIVSSSTSYYLSVPFAVGHEGDNFYLAVRASSSHTLKIEELTFVDNGTALSSKTVTANGTYVASSDNVVGYSTVSVAVPFSTITVSSSSPSGGSDGDIWIKTS